MLLAFGDAPDLSGLTAVIVHATAPAFLLGAVASFLSILTSRLERVMDRKRSEGIPPGDPARLRQRVFLLNGAIYLAVLAAVTTSALLVMAFGLAFFNVQHAYGVGALFTLALLFLAGALVQFLRDVHIATRAANLD